MFKRILIAFAALVGLGIVAGAIYLVVMLVSGPGDNNGLPSTDNNSRVEVSSVCDTEMIKSASIAIADYDNSALRLLSDRIVAIDKHENDPNCGYILIRYYLSIGQTEKAAAAIDQLQRVLSSGGAYSTAFEPPAVNIKNLRDTLKTLRERNDTQTIPGDELNKVDGSNGTNN